MTLVLLVREDPSSTVLILIEEEEDIALLVSHDVVVDVVFDVNEVALEVLELRVVLEELDAFEID